MRHIVWLTVVILGVWIGAATAQESTIESVLVEGNERIEAETVRSYMEIGPGDRYDSDAVNDSLKSLFDTGLFADVVIRREGNALVVRVVENPIINRVAFEGNDEIADSELEAEIQLQPRVVYTRPRVQSDLQRLTEIYRRSGRFAVTIEPKVIQLPQNRVDLVFEIDEGPVTEVEVINFVGNKRFSDSALRDEIQTVENAWYRFATSADTYDPDRLTFDRELLRRFYLANGYIDFRVISAVAELMPDRSGFIVTFSLEEGERYRVSAIDIQSQLRDLAPDDLFPIVEIEEGDWYDADQVEDTLLALTEAVGSRGYAFVDVRPLIEPNREARTVAVNFEVGEGPRVYVERIEIVGNVRTLDEVIRREFRLAEGDAYNTALIRRSRQRVMNLGFFSQVDIDTSQGSAPDRTVLTVEVTEVPTGELSFGAGVSSAEGVLGDISIRERNLLGRGQELRLGLTVSESRQEIDLSFTEPYFLDRDVAAGFDVFRRSVDLQDQSSFDRESIGVVTRAGYPLAERLRHTVSYTLRNDEVSDVSPSTSRFIRDQEGETTTSAIAHRLEYDLRDSRIDPTDGYFIRFGQEFAGLGGDASFLKHTLTYGHFYSVADGWVLSALARAGHIFGIDDDVRIVDRFFLGGRRLRGFEPSGVGPRDAETGDALGGNMFYSATGELGFPLGLPDELNLRGALFTDIGTLATIDETGPELLDESSLRLSIGVGINFRSPLGPIRLDFAEALIKEDYDRTESFRFSFGTRF
ncbi:MAG: outer membrane protein assembly factor BamA [Rhodospirillales bacterium]|nr:outer membrane protein assembly factor BamA [Rhodospirillales bacterium]MDE0379630.1 outer membrane protein assembly factor BamA [Rhodospirillales bacterium]